MSVAADGLPRLSDVIRAHGLNAKKSLGQNFLLDLQLTSKIARSAGSLVGQTIVEVGPGPGGLTRALLLEGADKVIAIERDERCLDALKEIAQHYPDRLDVIPGDALEIDYPALAPAGAQIVANLPYNVATPLFTGWLESEIWPSWWSQLTLMFQREVAQRITARVGDKAYGRLAILTAWRAEADILFDVPASAFTPPPKVTSSIVQIRPKSNYVHVPGALLQQVTAGAFGQRRKMLRASLKALGTRFSGGVEAWLEAADISPTQRAEEIDVSGFLRLTELLDARS